MDASSSEMTPTLQESLSELTATELNDQIAALPVFQCKKCDKLLVPPIRLVDGLGNICGKCYSGDESKTTLYNFALEVILQNLVICCPNKPLGCKERFHYFDLPLHLSNCFNRNYYCPFRVIENCQWEGSSSLVFLHCFENHSEYNLQRSDNYFSITIDVTTTNDMVRLLCLGSEQFILHVKCDLQSSSLYYTIYYMGDPESVNNFLYTVEQLDKNGMNNCSLQYKSDKILPHNINFSLEFDKENALRIDLSLLKQFVSDSVVETALIISSKDHTALEIDESLLSIFECPVCNNFMKPPIFQCLSGHSLCSRCRSKLGQCPVCRTGFGNTRNFSLETLSHRTKFPCFYWDLGCRTVLSALELSKHEIECSVKPYCCPFSEMKKCSWEGTCSNIASHVTLQHSDKTGVNNYIDVYGGLSYESTSDLHCIISNGKVFRVCHKYDRSNHNAFWAVQHVGPRGEAKNYKFEITILDSRNEIKKLIRTDLCQDFTSYENMFNHCVILPLNLVSMFSSSEGIRYRCKINKIDNI